MAEAGTLPELRAICQRDLSRLRRLEATDSWWADFQRFLQWLVGFLATLLFLLVFDIFDLLGKVLIASIVGLGFAWPNVMLAIGKFMSVFVKIADTASLATGTYRSRDYDDFDYPGMIEREDSRNRRLRLMIAAREAWLKTGQGPPPPRWQPQGRNRFTGQRSGDPAVLLQAA